MASLRSEVINSMIHQRKDHIFKSLKTDWGRQKFGADCPERDDYDYVDASENSLRPQRTRDTYIEFWKAFRFTYSSVEMRLALIHDAALFGNVIEYMTFNYGSESSWEMLLRKNDSPEVIKSVCQLTGKSFEAISNYALYKKTLYEIFESLKDKSGLANLAIQLEQIKKFGIDINTIKSCEEEMHLLEYLIRKGYYDIVEKFKLIISAGFNISKELAEKMLYLVCVSRPSNFLLMSEVAKYCNQKSFEGITLDGVKTFDLTKIHLGPMIFHPISLVLSAFEKYDKGSSHPDYENYIRSIKFLLTKLNKVDQSIIAELISCSNEVRMKPLLSLFAEHVGVSIEDKGKIKEKMTQLDQLAKQEKLDEEKRAEARFREYMNKLNDEAAQQDQILKLLKSHLAVTNIKLYTWSVDLKIQFETVDGLDDHLKKLQHIEINCEIQGGEIVLKEFPFLLLEKLKKQTPPTATAMELKDTPIVRSDDVSKALLACFGMPCSVNSFLENWHSISFEAEAPFEKIQDISRSLTVSGIKNKLEPGRLLQGGIIKVPAKIILENDTLCQIIQKLKNIKPVAGLKIRV